MQRDIVALQPVGVRLNPPDEMHLSRICAVLAYFEQWFRSRRSVLVDGMLDGTLRSGDDILRLPRIEVVEDVATLSSAFFDHQYPLLASRRAVLGRGFEGSLDVGRADVDLLAGDSLIEFNSAATDSPIEGWEVHQLLACACLDYSDTHRVRNVGLSVLRRNALREWDIEELVDALSAGQIEYRVLRERVHAFAVSLK